MEEIEKLKARVERDSGSKLFLPLAEEYRKSGMLDEAIAVILRGLEQQPDYVSARVALGRLYLEKEMAEEAKAEFEKVVEIIPDNLFSHKKLAEIYRERGDIQRAVSEYETILRLNPLDDEALQSMEEITGVGSGDLEVFPASEDDESIEAEPVEAAEVAEVTASEDVESIEAEPVEAVEVAEVTAIAEGEVLDVVADDIGLTAEEAEASEDAEVFEITGEPAAVEEETFDRPSERRSPQKVPVGDASDSPVTISDIDSFVAAGKYFMALEKYREVLRNEPDNKHVAQRALELKALMKMMGKSEELLIARLEAFLSGVRRRSGLFRSS